jgi:uncharacterized protein YdeI (YjbR/CyaY-like superfamily)
MKTMTFTASGDFRSWLAENHGQSDGILLRIYKKDSGVSTVTYAEALDQALCFGWIDGQKEPYDKQSWLQKFTPRRPKSGWSKNNTRHVERLIRTGEMSPSGHAIEDIARLRFDFDLVASAEIQTSTGSNWSKNSWSACE